LNLDEVRVRPVERNEEPLHRQLMATHHYLGYLPKIGQTVWYVATYYGEWVGLLAFSAAAWKCAVRDRWIGWDFHRQYDYDRLKLIANNSRFLILPHWHHRNLGSKILSLCQKRLARDWQERFGHPLLLLETFVDPKRFQGTVYRAANWSYLGLTRGYRRTRQGYSAAVLSPKKVFVKPLQNNARSLLARPVLPLPYRQGVPKMMLSAQQMQSLPDFFIDIPDPRRAQGRRHALPTVLAIACGAILCGMRGYKAIADWTQSLGPKARERFRCRRVNGRYLVHLSVNMMTYKMWTSRAFHSIIPSTGGEVCQERARVLSHSRPQNERGWRRWHGNIRHRIETSSEPRLHCTLLAV
jgi:GNAT superfamily N-acetyltransferase